MKRLTTPKKLSTIGKQRLAEVHPTLQKLLKEMLWYKDFSLIESVRSLAQQERNVAKGVSKTLKSKHLRHEDGFAHAVDIWPYPVPRLANGEIDSSSKEWDELALVAFYCAGKLGIQGLVWGGLWKTLVDKPHYELEV